VRGSIRAAVIAGAAAAAALALAACDGTADDGSGLPAPTGCPAATTVWIVSTGFAPPCVTVAPGATVRFQNTDTVNHTVTAFSGQPETFDSRVLAPGQEFSHTFASAAERVEVRCMLHPATVGLVLVQ
jgi:plastocyanin